jgi:hypothetical protein
MTDHVKAVHITATVTMLTVSMSHREPTMELNASQSNLLTDFG